MHTHRKTTHCIEGHCTINIVTSYSQIDFIDCATDESVRIAGLMPSDIKGAISCYIQNIVKDHDASDHIEWLKDLIIKAQISINRIESNEGK